VNEKKEVIKHSAAIQIENNITLLQRRTWNALLYNAYNELNSKEVHSISVPELARLIGYDSHDMEYLKEASLAMLRCIVQYNVLGKDGKNVWGATALLAQVKIENGLFLYAYSPDLRERLHNPAMYARLDLNMQKRFDSKHALALWELCTDYLGTGRDYGETPFISIMDFRKLMGIPQGQYARFKDLSLYVIKEPVTEINDVSDFCVSIDYQRQGRKVTALKFKIRRVVRLPGALTGQGSLFPGLEDMPVVVKELKEAGLSSNDAWDIWQQGFHCVEEAARPPDPGEAADTTFAQYVREKVHLLKRRRASGKVENGTGFLLEAIRRNYANPEFDHELKRRAAVEAGKASKEREKQVQTLEARKAEIEKARDEALDDMFRQIAMESPEVLETALSGIFAESPFYRQRYEHDKSALENYQASRILKVAFNPYLERHAPERVQAVKERYITQIAAVEERIAAFQLG
jgi:Initiator Replication protein